MTRKSKTPCGKPGCPNTTRSTYCDEHGDTREEYKNKNRSDYARNSFYQTKRWKKARQSYIMEHPTCEICGRKASEEVDHITPIREGGAKLDPDNLQALCKPCHSKKTAEEIDEFGGDTDKDKRYDYE